MNEDRIFSELTVGEVKELWGERGIETDIPDPNAELSVIIGESFNIREMAMLYYNNKNIDVTDLPPHSQALMVSLPQRMLYHLDGVIQSETEMALLDHAKDRFEAGIWWFMSVMLDKSLVRQLYDLEDRPIHGVLVRPWINRSKHPNGNISRKKATNKLQASIINEVHRAWMLDEGQVVDAVGGWLPAK